MCANLLESLSDFGLIYVYLTGTSSIVHEETHQPLLSTLSSVVETVVNLRKQGHKVVLVSSGAIGVGLRRMNIPSKPKSLSGKQVRFVGRSGFEGKIDSFVI